MEEKTCDEGIKDTLDSKCQKIPAVGEKLSDLSVVHMQNKQRVENHDSVDDIGSWTPVKSTQPLKRELLKDEAFELSDEYKTMIGFFDCMNSSLRLLHLRKKLPTFQKISSQVEVLTKRKFSYNHLAQIKYILPEAVQVEKILVHDEKTFCMKPDMKVRLLLDIVEAHPDQSPFVALRQLFRARLLDFFYTHPKGYDIPKAMLPEPFNQGNHTVIPQKLPMESPKKCHSLSELELPSSSAHLSSSFSKHFSQKNIAPEEETTQLLAPIFPLSSLISHNENNRCFEQDKGSIPLASKSCGIKSNAMLISSPQCSLNSSACESPLAKLISAVDYWMVETPVQKTPKRLIPDSDSKINADGRETQSSTHSAAKRSLNFSPLKGDGSTGPQPATTNRVLFEDVTRSCHSVAQKDKENNSFIMKDQNTSKKSCDTQNISLRDLFDLIHRIFHSASSCSITKEELVHKIILNNFDIVERSEVEEQLELLEKLAPDWICKKLVPSGDLLYRLRKIPDLESVRARLAEAL
ncbi:PREDICTED: CDT1-like protein a, chloroplastic isoform X2 [Nelumbo nucifera]|uniref:CDT1-like protein a, chloroplastic isoform X2 n=2 Tax=Nelumbo nucifera TaxID=4432 RepID=A0A1U7ZLV5_NELNU|nr:PREDICTED: CDT1-like protein a, chloroplastic isoform X2 [Nelumbo nucifera]DAD35921.1 TPA_asm: hypothetical protein HUJ06_006561 [Nelumbo nucifera]